MNTQSRASHHAPERVALDGPSASGKSTIGSSLASKWGHLFLDTGLMYRAVTFRALQQSIDLDDIDSLSELASNLKWDIAPDSSNSWRLIVDDDDVTDDLHIASVNQSVSKVSAVLAVRQAMVTQQRLISKRAPIVMAGRDIGTVVMPDAPLKIYLTASDQTRATRRYKDFHARGDKVDYVEVLRDIRRRDNIDSTRQHSPLRPAQDAIILSTDDLNAEEVITRILDLNPHDSGGGLH